MDEIGFKTSICADACNERLPLDSNLSLLHSHALVWRCPRLSREGVERKDSLIHKDYLHIIELSKLDQIPQNPSTYEIVRKLKNKFSWSISGISGSRMLSRGSQYFEFLRPFRLPWENSPFVTRCIFTCSIQWGMRHSPTTRTDSAKCLLLSGSPRILMLVIIIESLI